jgi:hypothetical protein
MDLKKIALESLPEDWTPFVYLSDEKLEKKIKVIHVLTNTIYFLGLVLAIITPFALHYVFENYLPEVNLPQRLMIYFLMTVVIVGSFCYIAQANINLFRKLDLLKNSCSMEARFKNIQKVCPAAIEWENAAIECGRSLRLFDVEFVEYLNELESQSIRIKNQHKLNQIKTVLTQKSVVFNT